MTRIISKNVLRDLKANKVETLTIGSRADLYKEAWDKGYQAGVKAAQPKWISVEERLPGYQADIYFIVCRDDGTVCEGRFEASNRRWYQVTTEGLWEIEITHWMPLPEPPKEEE